MKSSQLTTHLEFIKFIGAGGVAALVNFISRMMLSTTFDYALSIVIAYLIGMITAYALCRLFVFSTSVNTSLQQVSYFTLVNLLAILQTVIVSLFLNEYAFSWVTDVSFREASAHFIGICIPVFTSYLGHKYMTFK